MKSKITPAPEPVVAPAVEAPAAPVVIPPPAFAPADAVRINPTRHEPTGRTVGFVQGEHLFSATGVYIAPADEKPAFRPLPADL